MELDKLVHTPIGRGIVYTPASRIAVCAMRGASKTFAFADRAVRLACGILPDYERQRVRGFDPRLGESTHFFTSGQAAGREFVREAHRIARYWERRLGTRLVATVTQTEIEFRSGAVIRWYPAANALAIRGQRGHALFSEAAWLTDDQNAWTAGLGVAIGTIAKPEGYTVAAESTAGVDDSHFAKILLTDVGRTWARLTYSIHDAAADGVFKGDVAATIAEYPDRERAAAELECVFMAQGARYIGRPILDRAGYAPSELPREALAVRTSAGLDLAGVGHGSGRHLSALVELAPVGKELWLTRLEVRPDPSERDAWTWERQEAWVAERMPRIACLAVDASGLGSQFGSRLVQTFGSRVQPIVFSAPVKEELISGLRVALETGRLRIPKDDDSLARDIMSLRRVIGPTGITRFDIASGTDGHGDRAIALALAVSVANSVTAFPPWLASAEARVGPRDGAMSDRELDALSGIRGDADWSGW